MTATQRGILFSVLGALVAGVFIVFWKKASLIADWRQMAFLLFLFSAIIHVIYIPIKLRFDLRRIVSLNRKELICSAVFAVGAILGNLGSANALSSMSPPLVSAFERFEVLFVGLVGFALMGERLNRWFFMGFALVMLGMVVSMPEDALATSNVEAVMFSLIGACGFGSITVAGRYFRSGIDIAKVNLMRILICLAFMAAITDLSFITEPGLAWQPLYTYVSICAFMGPFLSRLFKMVANRTVSAGTTAMLALLQPVFAFMFSYALLADYQPSAAELGGCLIMIAGVLVAMRRSPAARVARLPRRPAKAA